MKALEIMSSVQWWSHHILSGKNVYGKKKVVKSFGKFTALLSPLIISYYLVKAKRYIQTFDFSN